MLEKFISFLSASLTLKVRLPIADVVDNGIDIFGLVS